MLEINLNTMSTDSLEKLLVVAELNMKLRGLITQLDTLTYRISFAQLALESEFSSRLKGMEDRSTAMYDLNLLLSEIRILQSTLDYVSTLTEKLDLKEKTGRS